VLGIATGEWANTGKTPIKIMIFGVSCLVLAIAILGYASNIDMTRSESTHRFTLPDTLSELIGDPFLLEL
jgi:hypothetical protein